MPSNDVLMDAKTSSGDGDVSSKIASAAPWANPKAKCGLVEDPGESVRVELFFPRVYPSSKEATALL